MGYDAPYKGLKVVDISQGISGPYIGMLMAQYRADVVKVEPLEREWVQLISRDYDKHSVFSVSAILGKRGLATCSYNRSYFLDGPPRYRTRTVVKYSSAKTI